MFYEQEGQNPNEPKSQGSRFKFLNIKEQNQNWSNLERVQDILVCKMRSV